MFTSEKTTFCECYINLVCVPYVLHETETELKKFLKMSSVI